MSIGIPQIADAATSTPPGGATSVGGYVVGFGNPATGAAQVPSSLNGQKVVQVAEGVDQSLALTSAGKVTAWGTDAAGEGVVPAAIAADTLSAIAAGAEFDLGLTTDGKVVAWGDGSYGATTVPVSLADKTVTAVTAGAEFSVALTSDGHVTAWGNPADGQTDVPASLDSKTVTAISANPMGQHALALASDGTVTSWGADSNGQTDIPSSLTGKTVTAIAAGSDFSLALTSDGKITEWGAAAYAMPPVPASLTGKTVTAIAAGGDYALALTSDGQLTMWSPPGLPGPSIPSSLTGHSVLAMSAGLTSALAIVGFDSPVVGTQPQAATVTSGATASFSAAAFGNPAPSIQWQKADPGSSSFVSISGATSTTYTTGAVTTASTGTRYRAVFTNSRGTATSSAATLTVNGSAPAISSVVVASPVSGDSARISATVTGTPTPTLQWFTAAPGSSTFTPIPGATTATYVSPVLTTADSGTRYRVVATNPEGTATSTTGGVTVTASTPTITQQPASVLITSGTSAKLTAAATADPNPTVKWQSAASGSSTFTDIPGATSPTFTTPTLIATDSGIRYRAVFSNAGGQAVSDPATVTVGAPMPVIDAPNGALGQAYGYTIPVAGTTAAAVSLTAGALPPGLALSADGRISGTPTAIGSFSFGINTNGTPATAMVTLSVQKAATITGVAPDGQTSTSYNWSPTLTGNPTVTLTSGALPTGVALTNNQLTGVPTKTGSYTFTLTADNGYGTPATLTSTVTIRQAPAFVDDTPATGTVGIAYSYRFATTGTPAPTVTLTGGTLPPGLTLNTDGTLAGTPTASGTYSITLSAANGSASPATAQESVFISSAPVIIGAPPAATTGAPYRYAFTVGGSPAPTVTANGDVPPGLTLNPDGTLTGTPTTAGTYSFMAVAGNTISMASVPVTMTVGDAATITADAPTGTLGSAYTHAFPTGGSSTVSVTATGVPDGLSISSAGVLSGTPTKAGTWHLTVTAANAYGTTTKSQDLTIDPATTGQAAVVAPPASVQPGASEGPNLQVFGERTNLTLTSAISVGGVTIPAGTRINSYYVHGDAVGSDNIAHPMSGSVSFGTKVLAVATSTADLEQTAALLGNPAVTYSTSADQGLEYDDSVTAGATGVLDLAFNVYDNTDAVRVITLAP